jgi:hypothetical protein
MSGKSRAMNQCSPALKESVERCSIEDEEEEDEDEGVQEACKKRNELRRSTCSRARTSTVRAL